jgi:dihydrofolate reductase
MMITFVVAMAENGVIGRDGRLPWRMPSDLKRFRKLTLDRPIIMGRKTYESIGKPLDRRDNIVITRWHNFNGIHVVAGVTEALELAGKLAAGRGADEAAVIGGAEVFRAALPYVQRVYLTLVRGNPAGDVVMPPLDPQLWRETAHEPMQQTQDDQYPADFVVLDRHG